MARVVITDVRRGMATERGMLNKFLEDNEYRYKVLKTMSVILTGLVMGIVFSHLGPVLPEMKRLIDSDLKKVSWLLTTTYMGFLLGVLISGVVFDRTRPMLFLFLASLSSTLFTALLPWLPNFWSMIVIRVCTGFAVGALNTAGIACISYMWQSEAKPFVHVQQLFLSIGGIFTPLIIRPFLMNDTNTGPSASVLTNIPGEQLSPIENNSRLLPFRAEMESNVTKSVYTNKTDAAMAIRYPFIILGIIGFLCSVSGLYFVCTENREQKMKTNNNGSEKANRSNGQEYTRRPKTITIILICTIAAQSFFYGILFHGFLSFLSTFLIIHMEWSSQTASSANAVFWAVFAGARAMGVYLVCRINPNAVIVVFKILAITGSLMCTVASIIQVDIFLWVALVLYAFSLSIELPSLFTWTEEYVCPVTGRITALFLFFMQTGSITDPICVGYLMEEVSPLCFCYVLVVSSSITLFLYIFANRMSVRCVGGMDSVTIQTNSLEAEN